MRTLHLLRFASLIALATTAGTAASSCAQARTLVTVTLAADKSAAPADGVSRIALTANVIGAPNAVVVFESTGAALLGATSANAVDGVATVTLFAPLEDQLEAGASTATSTVKASVTVNGAIVASETTVTFEMPAAGAPTMTAFANPDRVLAGSADFIHIVIDGRRLANGTVTLSSSDAALALPSSLALDDLGGGLFHGELDIAAAATPGDATVTITADGVAPIDIDVRFIEEGEAAFDMSGVFAEVGYGVVELGNLIFLNPNPQCLIAPTYSLITVEQTTNDDGTAQLTSTSHSCKVEMGDVNVHFLGTSTTYVDPGFVSAVNSSAPPPLSFALSNIGPGAEYDVPAAAIAEPLILGADMSANPMGALPADENDARVEDQDGDGQPGVTIHNSTQGDQHVVYRTLVTSMSGVIEGANGQHGMTSAETETKVFGGDSPLAPTLTAKASPWHQVRVDGLYGSTNIANRDGDATSISCADLDAFMSELEAAAPPPSPSTACN